MAYFTIQFSKFHFLLFWSHHGTVSCVILADFVLPLLLSGLYHCLISKGCVLLTHSNLKKWTRPFTCHLIESSHPVFCPRSWSTWLVYFISSSHCYYKTKARVLQITYYHVKIETVKQWSSKPAAFVLRHSWCSVFISFHFLKWGKLLFRITLNHQWTCPLRHDATNRLQRRMIGDMLHW